jgi:hypothetical protein
MQGQEYTYYQEADQERRYQAEQAERQLKRRALMDSKDEERAHSKCWLKKQLMQCGRSVTVILKQRLHINLSAMHLGN